MVDPIFKHHGSDVRTGFDSALKIKLSGKVILAASLTTVMADWAEAGIARVRRGRSRRTKTKENFRLMILD